MVSAGTGPVCFLARLCLRAGASEADAVESSETSVQRAVESSGLRRCRRVARVGVAGGIRWIGGWIVDELRGEG